MSKNLEDKLKEIADKLCTPKNEILYNVTLEEVNSYLNESAKQGYELCKKEYEEKLRWIPVGEKLPEIDESLSESDLHYSITVEVMNGAKIQSAYFNTETWQWRSSITGSIINPTHWRSFL